MTPRRPRHLSRRAAARLLDRSGAPPAPDRLTRLLDTATAPGGADELAGCTAAVAEYRRASLVPAFTTAQRRRSMIRSLLAKVATTKLIALSAVAAATGGIALAATNGTLPTTSTQHSAVARATD